MKILVKNVRSKVVECSSSEWSLLTDLLTVQEMIERRRGKIPPKFRPRRFYFEDTKTFWTGFVPSLRKVLTRHGYELDVKDLREPGADWPKRLSLPDGMRSRRYQKEAVSAAKAHGRGILHLPTGAGKLEIAAAILNNLPLSQCLYFVPGSLLANEAVERFEERLGEKVGLYGFGGESLGDRLTICSPSSMWSRRGTDEVKSILSSADGIFVDECHSVASLSDIHVWFSLVARCSSAYYRYGFSATPFSEDPLGNYRLVAVTGTVIKRVTEKYLIELGHLADPSVYMIQVPKREERLPAKKTWASIYSWAIVNNEDFTNIIARVLAASVDLGKHVLCVVDRIQHGKVIVDACIDKYNLSSNEIRFVSGSSSEKDFVLDEFKKKSFPALIISPTGHQGIDIPSVDVLVNAGGGKSRRRVLQKIGRGLRPGKTGKVDIVDFRHMSHRWVRQHSRARRSIYTSKEFNVTDLVSVDEFIDIMQGEGR